MILLWFCCPLGSKALVHAQSVLLCLTLCDSMDCSRPGSSVHEILQARILEWLPFPPPGDLPNPGIEPASLTSPALAGGFFTASATWKALSKALSSRKFTKKICYTSGWVVSCLATKRIGGVGPSRSPAALHRHYSGREGSGSCLHGGGDLAWRGGGFTNLKRAKQMNHIRRTNQQRDLGLSFRSSSL